MSEDKKYAPNNQNNPVCFTYRVTELSFGILLSIDAASIGFIYHAEQHSINERDSGKQHSLPTW